MSSLLILLFLHFFFKIPSKKPSMIFYTHTVHVQDAASQRNIVYRTRPALHPRPLVFLSSRSWTRLLCFCCLLASLAAPRIPHLCLLGKRARERIERSSSREGGGGEGHHGDGDVEVEGRLRPPHQAAADWGQRCVPAPPCPSPLPSPALGSSILACAVRGGRRSCSIGWSIWPGFRQSRTVCDVDRRPLLVVVLFPGSYLCISQDW
jgi:hypothetical protein